MYTLQNDCELALHRDGVLGGERFAKDINDRADRIKRLEFHIERGDYFSVLATIANTAAKENDFDSRRIFAKLYEDFLYLQENYAIVKKSKSDRE